MLSRYAMISLLFLIVSGVVTQEKDRYVGIPVGSINDVAARVSADVYVADDHTIVFDKFYHSPPGDSCIAVIIGPARPEDEDRKVGPGILMPYAQLDFTWEDLRLLWKRKKRQSPEVKTMEEMIGSLELTNPRWHIRGLRSTSSPNSNEASYEIIEYVDDEEELEENEEMLPKKQPPPLFIPHVQDGEVRHLKPTTHDTVTTSRITFIPTEHVPLERREMQVVDNSVSTNDTVVEQEAFDFLTSLPMEPTAAYTSVETTTTKPMIVFSKRKDVKVMTKKTKIKFKPTTIKLPVATTVAVPPTDAPSSTTTTTTTATRTTTTRTRGTTQTTTAETTKNVPKELMTFLVPSSENEAAVFLLTNGARITDYKWLGVWDACTNRSTPYIWLAGVDPPREEELNPLIDDRGRPVSSSVRLLNCNTVLVQKFRYKPVPDRLSTYFCVGNRLTGNKEQRTKVKVIGYEVGEPLEEFDGEDIMLRLPKGIRTFDMDFISVYNEDHDKTLARVIIPNALVPPCND